MDNQARPLARRVIHFVPGRNYTLSDENGRYVKLLPQGEFSAEIVDEELWETGCDKSSQAFSFNAPGQDVYGVDFPRTATKFIHNLRVSLTSSRMRAGRETNYVLQYENVGTVAFTGVVEMLFDDRLEFLSSSIPPDAQTNGKIEWLLNNIPIGASGQIFISVNVPQDVMPGTVICAEVQTAQRNSDVLLADDRDELCVEVTAGYDPNDIRVWPAGTGDEGWISKDVETLSYMIRFQNTGNDTTFTVVVRDTLPGSLDVKRLRFGAASHDYRVSLLDNHILEFTFPDIRLPDSTTDELGSQGYVKYRIDLQEDLEPGTQIRNRAGIYFDFNPVVWTNEAITTISEAVTSVEPQVRLNKNALSLHPNPVTEMLTISNLAAGAESLEIVDVHGRVIQQIAVDGWTEISVDCGLMAPGTYFLRIRGLGLERMARFVVVR